jgi:rod shape-determining protein MreB
MADMRNRVERTNGVFDQLFKSSPGIAIDLGTANTVVYVEGNGIVIDEPSVVAVERIDGARRIRAVGADARDWLGRTPDNLEAVRPVRNGAIADLEAAEQMILNFVQRAHAERAMMSRGPDVVICVPSGATTVERRAIRAAIANAGARTVSLIDEAMAAAIGAGLPVMEPVGSMVVDIGGGTTEVGVISLTGLMYSQSAHVGGGRMDEAIAAYVRRKYNILIGETTSERLKLEIGMAKPPSDGKGLTARVSGLDVTKGLPAEIAVHQAEIAEAVADSVSTIMQVVMDALEHAQPEIAADVIDEGITLTGGGSLLRDIDIVLADETGLPVHVAEDPLRCVALGAGQTLHDRNYRGVLNAV